jgi:hypothetical protein
VADKTESGAQNAGTNPWIARPSQQEQFSDAFLLAIAAGAGCAVGRPSPDNDSVDWTLSCRLPRRPKIDIQLKSTSAGGGSEKEIRYRLKAKNCRELSLPDLVVPRLLVLVVVPEDVEDWLCFSPRSLTLHKAAYWLSLAGGKKLSNSKSFMVSIPGSNLFTSEVLRHFMKKVEAGEPL